MTAAAQHAAAGGVIGLEELHVAGAISTEQLHVERETLVNALCRT